MNLRRHTASRPAGHVFETTPEGRLIEHDTLQCVHCGAHWVVRPGSGRVRGWCLKCCGPTCGQGRCDECIPVEKKLDQTEGGIYLT